MLNMKAKRPVAVVSSDLSPAEEDLALRFMEKIEEKVNTAFCAPGTSILISFAALKTIGSLCSTLTTAHLGLNVCMMRWNDCLIRRVNGLTFMKRTAAARIREHGACKK